MKTGLYPRFALKRLETALTDTPVVLIHGPRQCGKSTLAQIVANKHAYQYLTLDDNNIFQAAKEDPVGFCRDLPEKAVIDEIQRLPELFTSIKASIDRNRRPGRIILTGSANIMLLPRLADSLAGRMEVIRLLPLSQAEIEESTPGNGLVENLFTGRPPSTATASHDNDIPLMDRLLRGGFPTALLRTSPRRRQEWQVQYMEALTRRDMRDLARIRSLQAIPRLLEAAAAQTARLFNVSELAGPFEISRQTIREYLTLLENIFLIDLLPPWHSNRLSRLVKTPKLHMVDAGLTSALLHLDNEILKQDRTLYGQLLETFVYQELRKQSTWAEADYRFYHYRDKDLVEVDIIAERAGGALCGIEVKASATVRADDFKGLKRLKASTGRQFRCGVVLYDGDHILPFGEQLFAVPISALWM